MKASRLLLVACTALACASACSGGFRTDAPAPQTYVLRAAPGRVDALPAAPSLQVTRPLATPGFETDRVVLLRSDRRLDHFRGIRWAAELPEVVEAFAVETLRGSGALGPVHDSAAAFASQYVLRIAIRRFEADYTARDGAPRVQVALDCMLARRRDREVLASFAAEGTADARANRVSAVIDAFEIAAAAAADSMASQIFAALATQAAATATGTQEPEG